MGIRFQVSLVDGVSGAARKAAGGMTQAAAQAKVLQGAMNALEKQAVKAQALGDTSKLKKLTSQWDKFGDALGKLGPQIASPAGEMEAMSQSTTALSAAMDPVLAVVAALGAACLAVAASIGALLLKGAELAIEAVEWKDKMTAVFDALGDGPNAGEATMKMLDGLSAKLPQSRRELAGWANELEALGMTDLGGIENSLTAMASAQAINGEKGARAFEMLTKRIQTFAQGGQALKIPAKGLGSLIEMGIKVDDVAKRIGRSAATLTAQLKSGLNPAEIESFGAAVNDALINKGAHALDVMGRQLSVLKEKALDNLTKLFEGVDISPFTNQLKKMSDVFEANTQLGQAFGKIVRGIFDPLFALTARVIPYVVLGFLKLVNAALSFYITIKTHLDTIGTVLTGLGYIAVVVGAVIGGAILLAVGPLLLMAAAGVALWTALGWVAAKVGALGSTIASFVTGAGAAMAEWVSSAAGAAKNFVAGLVEGIKHGATQVVDAVKGLGAKAEGALADYLHMRSPSRVMMDMGGNVSEGFAQGIEDGSDRVASASQGMAMSAAGGAAAPPSSSSSSSVQIDVGGIHIGSAGSAAEALKLTEEAFASVFERVALQQGLLPNAT